MRFDVLAAIASSVKRFFKGFLAAIHESRRIKAEQMFAEYRHLFHTYDPMIGVHVGMPSQHRAARFPVEAAPRPIESAREPIPHPLPTLTL